MTDDGVFGAATGFARVCFLHKVALLAANHRHKAKSAKSGKTVVTFEPIMKFENHLLFRIS